MTPARRSLLLFGLLALSAAAVTWDRLGGRPVAVSNAVARKPAPSTLESSPSAALQVQSVAELRARTDYTDKGGDAFPSLLPPAAPVAMVQGPPIEAPRPVAPPVPFTVIGKKLERGTWEVYLARGDQIYIATQGAVLASDYRVSAISPTQLTLIYLPLNEKQTLLTGASLHD